MRFLSAFFLLAWFGLSATPHAAGVTPDGTPPPATPNPSGMVDVTPTTTSADFVDVDLDVFNALPDLPSKLAYIKEKRASLNRQLALLNQLTLDNINALIKEAKTDRNFSTALTTIWVVGNIVITVVLVTNPTLALLGITAANPLWLQMLLAWANVANGLVGKAADYFKEKETNALKQMVEILRRIVSDIQQAKTLQEANVAQQRVATEFADRVRELLAQPPAETQRLLDDPTVEPVVDDGPFRDLETPTQAVNVQPPDPDLFPQLGPDAFFNVLSPEEQLAYIAAMSNMLKTITDAIGSLNGEQFQTLIDEVGKKRKASSALNWGWVLAHGAQTALLAIMPTLTLYNVIPNQQWLGLASGGLGALGTILGVWADRFAQGAVDALTQATQYTRHFAENLNIMLIAYQKQYNDEHHAPVIANMIRSVTRPAPPVTRPRPPPPAVPPSLPLVSPARDNNEAALRLQATLNNIDPEDPTNKGKAEVSGRQPQAAPPPPQIVIINRIYTSKVRKKKGAKGAGPKIPVPPPGGQGNDVPMQDVPPRVENANATGAPPEQPNNMNPFFSSAATSEL